MIIGHKNILKYLDRLVEKQSFAHAYIFSGPANVGKTTVLEKFINDIICVKGCHINLHEPLTSHNYTDFYYLTNEEGKKEITVEQVRNLKSRLSLSSFSDNYKITVIEGAEKLNAAASNALLKLLEEPTPKTLIFLLTADAKNLLPTIQSRSVTINFQTVSPGEIEAFLKKQEIRHSDLESLVRLAQGRPGLALAYLQNHQIFAKMVAENEELILALGQDLHSRFEYWAGLEAEDFEERLGQLMVILRDLLLLKNNLPEKVVNFYLIDSLTRLQEKISANGLKEALNELQNFSEAKKYNVNRQLFIENALLKI